jgi:hypothetical protein
MDRASLGGPYRHVASVAVDARDPTGHRTWDVLAHCGGRFRRAVPWARPRVGNDVVTDGGLAGPQPCVHRRGRSESVIGKGCAAPGGAHGQHDRRKRAAESLRGMPSHLRSLKDGNRRASEPTPAGEKLALAQSQPEGPGGWHSSSSPLHRAYVPVGLDTRDNIAEPFDPLLPRLTHHLFLGEQLPAHMLSDQHAATNERTGGCGTIHRR